MTAAPPTRSEIDNALRLQDEFDRGKPTSAEEAKVVVAGIYADWQRAKAENIEGRPVPDIQTYIRDLADHGEVTNPDRGVIRAFWSYHSQPEGAPRDVRHQFLAQACGQSRGYQVLEETPAGGLLDSYHLSNPHVKRVLASDHEVDTAKLVDATAYAWRTVSDRYADAAKGPVVAFATDIDETSILGANEMPIILEKVGKDAVSFPLPMPRHEHLPPEIDALIANPAIRAQVRMQDFSPNNSPKEFAAKLAALDIPDNQLEAHEAALWRLSTANTYDDFAPSTEQNAIPQQKGSAFAPGVTTQPAPARAPAGHGVYDPAAVETPPPAPAPAPTGIEH
ncbi:hypothetical protein [Streptomyces sp. NPDC001927]